MANWKQGAIVLGLICLVLLSAWPTPGAERTKLTFLTWKPHIPEPWDRLIRQFEAENPKIQIQRQVGPQSSTDFHAIVSQRLKNRDSSVDVFFMDVIWPPEFASANWALDLTTRFTAEEQKAFLGGPIAANTYGGRIYGVPGFVDAGLLFYRKDLLEKHGLGPPTTWHEMLSHGRTILQKEQDPNLVIYSGQFKQYEGLVCNMLEFIWSNGGAVLGPRLEKVMLAEPGALESVAFVRDQIVGGAAPSGVLGYQEPESLALFVQGKAIFHRNWPYAWTVGNDPEHSKVAGGVLVASLPAFEGRTSVPALGGWQFGVNRWSRHPDAAWRFVHFMTSYDSQKILALEAGRAPTRRAVYEDPEVRQKMPHLLMFLPAFENARPRPVSPVYPAISQELQRFFSQAITRKESDISRLAQTAAMRIKKLAEMGARLQP